MYNLSWLSFPDSYSNYLTDIKAVATINNSSVFPCRKVALMI